MGQLHLPARHVARLGGGIDELVHRLHGEVPGHELDDRPQARHRRADAEAGEAVLGDRRVDDAARAEFLQQALAHLVGALIFRDLLAHQEHVAVAAHLLGHGIAQRLAHGQGHGRRRSIPARPRAPARLPGAAAATAAVGFGAAAPAPARARVPALGRRRRGFRRAWPPSTLSPSPAITAIGQIDGDVLGALGHDDAGERALVHRLHLHRRLVGLDLGEHVAGLDRVAGAASAIWRSCPRSWSATAPASALRSAWRSLARAASGWQGD